MLNIRLTTLQSSIIAWVLLLAAGLTWACVMAIWIALYDAIDSGETIDRVGYAVIVVVIPLGLLALGVCLVRRQIPIYAWLPSAGGVGLLVALLVVA